MGAVGFDWIVEFNNEDKGIGTGSDQIAPFGGLAFRRAPTNLVLIPLVQHFTSYGSGPDINQTAARLIALQPFGEGYWVKLDARVPYDWENEEVPASAELQLGYNLGPSWAVYAEGLLGVGGDRPYDAGAGLGSQIQILSVGPPHARLHRMRPWPRGAVNGAGRLGHLPGWGRTGQDVARHR